MLTLDILAFILLINDELARVGAIRPESARDGKALFNLAMAMVMRGLAPETAEGCQQLMDTAFFGLKMVKSKVICDGLHCGGCQVDALLAFGDELLIRMDKLEAKERKATPAPVGIHLN